MTMDEQAQLANLAEADAEFSKPYLRAIASRTADRVKHDGEWVRPGDLPGDVIAANAKTIADWRYRSNAGNNRHEP